MSIRHYILESSLNVEQGSHMIYIYIYMYIILYNLC